MYVIPIVWTLRIIKYKEMVDLAVLLRENPHAVFINTYGENHNSVVRCT